MSSKLSSIFLALTFLYLITVFSGCFADITSIMLVLNKLEAFVHQGKTQSDLTFADLQDAYSEFERLDETYRHKLMERQPLFQMIAHVLFIPMEKHPLLFSNERDPGIADSYMRRLERYYRELRPAYFGHQLGGPCHRSKKTNDLIAALLSDKSQLTSKMFRDAATEYYALKDRFYEIGEVEDIFACIGELKQILNYLNRPEINVSMEKIFPLFANAKDGSVLSSSKDLFRADMAKQGYTVENEKLRKLSRAEVTQMRQTLVT